MLRLGFLLVVFLSVCVASDDEPLLTRLLKELLEERLESLDAELRSIDSPLATDDLDAVSKKFGISVGEDVKNAGNRMKLSGAYAWIICKIRDDKTSVEVESTSTSGTYADFYKTLGELTSPRFVIYRSPPDWPSPNKMVQFLWIADGAKLMDRMMYRSTIGDMTRALLVAKQMGEVDATDIDTLKNKIKLIANA